MQVNELCDNAPWWTLQLWALLLVLSCTNSWVSNTRLQIVLLMMVFQLLVEGPSWRLFLVLSRPSLLVGSCHLFTFRHVLSLLTLVIDALPSHCDHASICILFPADACYAHHKFGCQMVTLGLSAIGNVHLQSLSFIGARSVVHLLLSCYSLASFLL